ncbi:MAG: EAL domain-containing protein [Arenimonas sp.]|uniref:putative bifunctional diguanylate cyclase/phosphodiesterase n=1 Tax=Arenimonas sp. TaxID=1872635 RepID=UPI0025BC31C4|nr:bifunctional diguanylate cyclase/phosphodiesterase [Arenimonas sp.]MBW8368961.1 EAL domain-containing protein [Arenimonas sp.]
MARRGIRSRLLIGMVVMAGVVFMVVMPLADGLLQDWSTGLEVESARATPGPAASTLRGADQVNPLVEHTRVVRQLLLAISIGIFLAGSLLVWRLVDRGVISRLERMQHELRAMADGERDALSPGTHGDEVDMVADRINHLYAEVKLVSGQWRHEAMHDALTGLGNRANLLQQLEGRLAGGSVDQAICLVLVDLDGFKAINDLFGHAMGDYVLIQVAVCLRQDFGNDAQCFRLGGDEFAVFSDCSGSEHALGLAERVNLAIAGLALSGMTRGIVGGSIGVSMALPGDVGVTAGQMLQCADVALYNVKRDGRNGRALFDDAMLKDMQLRNDLLCSLDEAIAGSALEAWYQPIVAASDHRVQRLEVLARWHHPESGWIDPARFIAIAELNNMAASLDVAVLERALRAMPQLQAHAPGIALSVNVSAQSLLDDDYVNAVTALLSRPTNRGVDLTLEITETAFTDNEQALLAPVAALQALGVQIVLDDFGVGYSSLGRLAHIQPRGIKLDGSFVRNRREGGDRICRAVIALAHEFGIAVTAEWIETSEDAECLRAWDCDALQGYHFAAAMPLDGTLAWLAARRVAAA